MGKMWTPRPTAIRIQFTRPEPEPAPITFKTGPIVLVEKYGNELKAERLESYDSSDVVLQVSGDGKRIDFDLDIPQQVMVAQYLIDNLKVHAVGELARLLVDYCPTCE